MKDDPQFESLDSYLNAVESTWNNNKGNSLKAYSDDSNSITAIITTNDIEYEKEISYQPLLEIKDTNEIHISEKGYHKYVHITLQAEPISVNEIVIRTFDNDIFRLRGKSDQFYQLKNVGFKMAKIKCEQIIANIVYDISTELRIEPFLLKIQKIACHPQDTRPIFIYQTVIKIFSKILDVDSSFIKSKLEDKLSFYEFLYSEINPIQIQFLKTNGTVEYDGMRIVRYNNELSSNAILTKTIDANSLIANEIKDLFIRTKESTIASPCVPTYRDAIVYRNSENEIVSYFHICFECAKIESHNRTQMPITNELLNGLNEILNPADSKR